MLPPAGPTKKFISAAIYIGIFAVTVWGGMKIINYSIDSKFYQNFLLNWEVSIHQYNASGGRWPEFKGGNHVAYMDSLVAGMHHKGIETPSSNTDRAYVYLINKIDLHSDKSDIFLLCFSGRIIMYGMSKETFNRIDQLIDEDLNQTKGHFIGYLSKNNITYTGQWRLY